jgi:hypothetical protein
MYHFLRVNIVQRNADHCDNSQDIFFWNELFFVILDYIRKTLVALFHYNTRMVSFIFDQVDYSYDLRVI